MQDFQVRGGAYEAFHLSQLLVVLKFRVRLGGDTSINWVCAGLEHWKFCSCILSTLSAQCRPLIST